MDAQKNELESADFKFEWIEWWIKNSKSKNFNTLVSLAKRGLIFLNTPAQELLLSQSISCQKSVNKCHNVFFIPVYLFGKFSNHKLYNSYKPAGWQAFLKIKRSANIFASDIDIKTVRMLCLYCRLF